MYKSPIEILTRQMRTQFEDNVFKAIQDYGIVVDKEELIKALQYDRDQYEKGFADGMLARKDEWISVEERLPEFEHWQTIVDGPFPIPTSIKVLCALQTKDGYIIREGTYEINDGLPWFSVKGRVAGIVGITHWMPLPEAPKGGAE